MSQRTKNILVFIPAVAMMCLIFYLSGQVGHESGGLSAKVCEKIIIFFEGSISAESMAKKVEMMQLPIRKLAHFSEYALLCLLWIFAFRYNKYETKQMYLLAFMISAAYAGTDEFHQSFVEGRCGAFTDVLIDSSAAALASFIHYVKHRV